MIPLTSAWFLGLLLGVRHAFEPDHLAAVSTLVTARGTPRSGVMLGAVWGVGHTLALLIVGGVLAAFQSGLPQSCADGFEFLVAAMLVTLGTRAIVRARVTRTGWTAPTHDHAADIGPRPDAVRVRSNHDPAGHFHIHTWTLARQPLAIGVIHGLAGSGALTALVMAEMPTVATRVAYMTLFGAGSIVGMASLTGIAGWPLARLGSSQRFSRGLSLITGTFSLLLGIWWGWSALHGHLG